MAQSRADTTYHKVPHVGRYYKTKSSTTINSHSNSPSPPSKLHHSSLKNSPMMMTLCTNVDREDALETVLEVPVPEETFTSKRHNSSWQLNIKSWLVRPSLERPDWRSDEIQSLLGVIGAPLIPLPLSSVNDYTIKGHPIERSMAKYIVEQYVAASGGHHALDKIQSMCAIGKVEMASSEFVGGQGTKMRNMKIGPGQLGGFVLWQKGPDMWSIELMLSGFKISAGSDGKVAWRQTAWQNSQSSRGPPRPLRRSLQGLDPRSTANLFSNSTCMGEKIINGEDCFVLKLEAEESTLRSRSSSKVEMIWHTVFGYFSHKTGLLVHLEDSQLLRIDDVFWETNMESRIQDYRTIEGVNIAHGGRTSASLFRFGQDSESNARVRMEEVWSIEEVDFNARGLSAECFMAPAADLKIEEEECELVAKKKGLRCSKVLGRKICAPKSGARVVAIDDDNLELFVIDE